MPSPADITQLPVKAVLSGSDPLVCVDLTDNTTKQFTRTLGADFSQTVAKYDSAVDNAGTAYKSYALLSTALSANMSQILISSAINETSVPTLINANTNITIKSSASYALGNYSFDYASNNYSLSINAQSGATLSLTTALLANTTSPSKFNIFGVNYNINVGASSSINSNGSILIDGATVSFSAASNTISSVKTVVKNSTIGSTTMIFPDQNVVLDETTFSGNLIIGTVAMGSQNARLTGCTTQGNTISYGDFNKISSFQSIGTFTLAGTASNLSNSLINSFLTISGSQCQASVISGAGLSVTGGDCGLDGWYFGSVSIAGSGNKVSWIRADIYATTIGGDDNTLYGVFDDVTFNGNNNIIYGVVSGTVTDNGTGNIIASPLASTAAGRAMLNAADATAQKILLSLGNVDNTSDANKPVSTAQQTALDLKANSSSPSFTGLLLPAQFIRNIIGSVTNATYTVQLYCQAAGTILSANQMSSSLGTAGTYTVAINGTPVTGLTAITNAATNTQTTASAANTFAIGDVITVDIAGSVALVDFNFAVNSQYSVTT